MLLAVQDLRLSFPDKVVLDGVSLTLARGDHLALIGENGAGKTSLFRIILGELAPDAGQVHRPAALRIEYLSQTVIEPQAEAASRARSCLDVAAEAFADVHALEAKLRSLEDQLTAAAGEEARRLLADLGEVQSAFEAAGGYDWRARVETALRGLGLPDAVWTRDVHTLSAGQQVRLALARVLLAEHDLLLLDEPTNHLDLQAREWLEAHLASLPGAFIVASHDRRFLDAVARRVAHLERGKLSVYTGNYSAFRAQQAHHLQTAWRTYDKRERQVRRLRQQARNYREWAGAREREKRGRVDKGYIGHKAAKLMKRSLVAQRRLEATIERMEVEKPRGNDPVAISFPVVEGHTLLRTRHLAVGVPGRPAFIEGVTLTLEVGERLAVLGSNGSGKTTLLRTLLGLHRPLAGEARLVPSARPGFFDQDARGLPAGASVLQAVGEVCGDETLVRTVLGRMRVRRDTVLKPVQALSAGERAKVLLTRLILGAHTLLVLDEPTNYLDIETQDALLEALREFPGGVIFVSHDRHLIDTLATKVMHLGVIGRSTTLGGAGQ